MLHWLIKFYLERDIDKNILQVGTVQYYDCQTSLSIEYISEKYRSSNLEEFSCEAAI